MEDLTVEQPGDRLQPDVRMRSDVDAVLLGHAQRPHVIHETPRPDASPRPLPERATNLHVADQCVWLGMNSTHG